MEWNGILYLSAFIVNLVNLLDGIEVVHAGIDTNFIQHDDAGFLRRSIQLFDGRRNIAGGDDVGSAFDC